MLCHLVIFHANFKIEVAIQPSILCGCDARDYRCFTSSAVYALLTYIHAGPVDAVYYIRLNGAGAAVLNRPCSEAAAGGSASGGRNPAGSAAKHTVTRVISGSVTLGKGPLPGTPSF